jgi:hypothetical protein
MANFEAFLWCSSLSTNPEIVRSDMIYDHNNNNNNNNAEVLYTKSSYIYIVKSIFIILHKLYDVWVCNNVISTLEYFPMHLLLNVAP